MLRGRFGDEPEELQRRIDCFADARVVTVADCEFTICNTTGPRWWRPGWRRSSDKEIHRPDPLRCRTSRPPTGGWRSHARSTPCCSDLRAAGKP